MAEGGGLIPAVLSNLQDIVSSQQQAQPQEDFQL